MVTPPQSVMKNITFIENSIKQKENISFSNATYDKKKNISEKLARQSGHV